MNGGHVLLLAFTLLTVSWSGKTDEITSASPPVPVDNLAQTVNDFGYKLMLKMMKRNVNNNIVMSPTGIAGLLAMSLLGSVGKTYDELADALGFSQDILTNRKNHEQLGELLQALKANDTQTKTLYADAIFVDANTQIREAYRNYLQNIYHGDALSAHFADDVKSKELVNDWVKNNTGGKIEDFLEDPLPISTKIVLLSALFFSGQWAQPFAPEYTAKMPFTTPTGNVTADLMLNSGSFDYKFSLLDGFHIIAFPYNDNITTMYVLKPRFPKRLTLPELLGRIDYTKINEIINKMRKEECVIRFPKLELKSKVDLEQSLKDLGMTSMFSPAEANFALMVDGNAIPNKTEEELITRINLGEEERGLKELVGRLPNPEVYVDSVLHDVKITVNEFGTEAVAVTSGVLARSAVLFYANSPFYMFIRNEVTQLVTFSAVIFDPTAATA